MNRRGEKLPYPDNLVAALKDAAKEDVVVLFPDDAIEYTADGDETRLLMMKLQFKMGLSGSEVAERLEMSTNSLYQRTDVFLQKMLTSAGRRVLELGAEAANKMYAEDLALAREIAETVYAGEEFWDDLTIDRLNLPDKTILNLRGHGVNFVSELALLIRRNWVISDRGGEKKRLFGIGVQRNIEKILNIQKRSPSEWAAEFADAYGYVFSVCCAVFGETPSLNKFLDVNVKGVIQAIGTLKLKEERVLELRFKKGLSLEAAGKELGVTRERIRQIEAKALRKLRHPSRSGLMKNSKLESRAEGYRESAVDAQKKYSELLEKHNALLASLRLDKIIEDGHKTDNLSLEELGLTARSYNSLRRAGVRNPQDILAMSYEKLSFIRGLGLKCLLEIALKMRDAGFREWGGIMIRENPWGGSARLEN